MPSRPEISTLPEGGEEEAVPVAAWSEDPSLTFAEARRQNKCMALLFTAHWSDGGQSLSQEVFASKTFNRFANEHLLLCYLDFPRTLSDAPDWMQNLKVKYGILGYPNLLIFDPRGNIILQLTGYRKGRPVDFFNAIEEAVKPQIELAKETRKELIAKGFREWENREGHTFFGRFLQRGESLVSLQDQTGKEWTVPIATLSGKDQQFLASFPMVHESGEPESISPAGR